MEAERRAKAELSPLSREKAGFQQRRLTQIREVMKREHADAFLLSNPDSFGFTGFAGSVPEDREALATVTDTSVSVFARKLYEGDQRIARDVWQEVDMEYFPDGQPWQEKIQEVLQAKRARTIAVEEDNLTLAEGRILEHMGFILKPATLEQIKREKDPYEIEAIAQAAEIGDRAYAVVIDTLRERIKNGDKITESGVRDLLDGYITSQGGTPSFGTIIAFGNNAGDPHYETGDTLLREGSPLLLDFGVKKNGYCSDTTRMLWYKPTDEQRKVYKTVVAANQAALSYVEREYQQFGHVETGEIDKTARNVIASLGYPDYPHRTGHSIGKKVHEQPDIKQTAIPQFVGKGSVFTIEPGIYQGLNSTRFEQQIALIEEHGQRSVRVLTKGSAEFIDLAEDTPAL